MEPGPGITGVGDTADTMVARAIGAEGTGTTGGATGVKAGDTATRGRATAEDIPAAMRGAVMAAGTLGGTRFMVVDTMVVNITLEAAVDSTVEEESGAAVDSTVAADLTVVVDTAD